MKVVLAFPFWTSGYPSLLGYFARRNSTWPPLNLALLAACCEKAGHDVSIIDAQCEGLTHEQLADRIIALKPHVVGFTATSPFYSVQIKVAEILKCRAPHIVTCVGGPHITILHEKAETWAFDFYFTGECEEEFPKFLTDLQCGYDMPRIIKGSRVASFDALPMPARHLLPMHRYKLGTLRGRLNFTSIQTTRGCPFACTFCASDKLDTKSVFRRSADSVVAEIRHIVETYDVRHLYIVDDVLSLKRSYTVELCNKVIAGGLDITFEGSTRANLLDEELVILLKRAGLIRLSFGLESADDNVRDLMLKKCPLDSYVESNRLLNKHGIEVLNSTMVGLPGDTRETIRKTIAWVAESHDIQQANLSIATPYPGTAFYDMAQRGEHGLVMHTDDFSKFFRYGSAITSVGDLTPRDLVELQNEGFVRIYSKPWRWRSVYGKHGLIGLGLTLVRLARMLAWKAIKNFRPPVPGIALGHAGSPKAPNG